MRHVAEALTYFCKKVFRALGIFTLLGLIPAETAFAVIYWIEKSSAPGTVTEGEFLAMYMGTIFIMMFVDSAIYSGVCHFIDCAKYLKEHEDASFEEAWLKTTDYSVDDDF